MRLHLDRQVGTESDMDTNQDAPQNQHSMKGAALTFLGFISYPVLVTIFPLVGPRPDIPWREMVENALAIF